MTGMATGGLRAGKSRGEVWLSAALLRRLRLRVGRVLFSGFPTGVRVGASVTAGGPFPATTTPLSTSVGVRAIDPFMRPVTYQDVPQCLRREALSWS